MLGPPSGPSRRFRPGVEWGTRHAAPSGGICGRNRSDRRSVRRARARARHSPRSLQRLVRHARSGVGTGNGRDGDRLRRAPSKVEADAAVDRANLALDQATHRKTETTTAPAESPSSAGGSLVSDLERLATLRRAGDLTAQEFRSTKQQLLTGAPQRLEYGHNIRRRVNEH